MRKNRLPGAPYATGLTFSPGRRRERVSRARIPARPDVVDEPRGVALWHRESRFASASVLFAFALSHDHPWARGGHAYFDPAFDPRWRAWLARPAGRIVFAGEHTSVKSQGYMNGAIETGLRAAAEIAALRHS